MEILQKIQKAGKKIQVWDITCEQVKSIHCYLTGETGPSGGETIRGFKISDKHGFSRLVYNIRINIRTDSGSSVLMGTPTAGARVIEDIDKLDELEDDYTGYRRAQH